MSGQPIKNAVNYEAEFSNEIRNLLNTTITSIAKETIPSRQITPELFFLGALSNQDCMLYKVVNGFFTTMEITEIYDSLFLEAQKASPIAVMRPFREIDYSSNMKALFHRASKEKNANGDEYITSDHVLLALLNATNKSVENIYNIFAKNAFNYEIAKGLSKQVHETTSALLNVNDEDIVTAVDIADGKDTSVITISGSFDDGDSPEEILDKIAGALSQLGVSNSQSEKKSKVGKSNLSYCTNLNSKAEKGEIDTLTGREDEINKILKIFGRRKCNNVVLVGESGVGKTAIVEGITKQIVDGNAPIYLKDCRVFALNTTEIMAGTQFKGMFEERLNNLIKEMNLIKNLILFIDDFHNILNEKNKNDYDFSGILSNVFNGSNIKVIAATTPKGYHTAFDSDPILSRKFQKIIIEKPTIDECLDIVTNAKTEYEKFHKVHYTPEAVKASIILSNKYITERSLPASALEILDEAGSAKKILLSEPKEIRAKRDAIAELKKEKDKLIKEDKINDAQDIDFTINGLKLEIAQIQEALGDLKRKDANVVTEEDIYTAVSEHTNIPVQKITTSEKKFVSKVDEILKRDIVGQDEAIDIISRAIKRSKVGLSPKNRPIFSCMCIGNTGTGKTLLAKKLANEIFGDEKYLVRFDMSEYSDKTAVNKLIGSAAGYIGYSEGGLLTEAIKNKKHCVLLIDEIEKSTDEIFNLFLQILDEGYLNDNTGQKVDFKNTVLILTSNVGAKRASGERPIGFNPNESVNKKNIINKELKRRFPPEFINRLDEIVYFNDLTNDNLKQIIRLELNKLNKKLNELGHLMKYTDDVVEYIYKIVEPDKEYGARPILRTIQNELENGITDLMLDNDFEHHTFEVEIIDDKLSIK